MTERPMPTEEGILAFHKRCEDFYPADAVDADITQQRAWYDALCAAFDAPPPVGMVKEDGLVAERISVRRYRPGAVTTGTRLFYIHGGGFVVGSLDSHDAICAELSEAAGAELVSIDYRLSPEHVWPAAFEDCWAVLVSLLQEGRPVVVIGDSAGGNLAAGIVLKARDEGLEGIVGQAFVGGGFDDAIGHHDLAAGQGKGVGPHARAKFQRQRRPVAVVTVQRSGCLPHQRIQPCLECVLPRTGQRAGLERAVVHLL